MVVTVVIIALYYVISSWRILKGAQWAIVWGVLATLFWVMLWGFIRFTPLSHGFILVVTAIFLSFPLSLLVYVSLRFKEIINEVRENARQLVQVTEEKKQQALKQQKLLEQEVKRQTADLTQTLQNLKTTQSQLIQSEKMASLGDLTAGIAHEIQNPLNFVNNFSDVNKELLAEIREEISKGNYDEVRALAKDVADNEEKINQHGKRADAIVKGMLQHSRSSSGQKEVTDINKLADEYFRLAYHGLRAKDKSFNVTMKTDFDETIETINVVPQDIGRVILNLITNAFYAVDEKRKAGAEKYEPTVFLSTKKLAGTVQIRVTDNGSGIPKKVLDKIFQPFFTTKPTGQGTGLGLSLSYDIVKAHGGEIHVESKEGDGSTFTIALPG
jgi:signal transduction histidine kinase